MNNISPADPKVVQIQSTYPGMIVDLAASSSTVFRAEDQTSPSFYIKGILSGGVLAFEVVAESMGGQKGTFSGKQFFAAMITYFGLGNITAIKGVWTSGVDLDTNIDQFNYWTGLQGGNLMPKDAALKTWTGQRAIEHGFPKVVSVGMLLGTPGAYRDVVVTFAQ